MVFADHPGDHSRLDLLSPQAKKRYGPFANSREPVFYDANLQAAHHIHFNGYDDHRILQHHYGKDIIIHIFTMFQYFIFLI